ncbi:energy-coupling factor transporter ATPase [Bombilactobacillus thymidiniphilus]|uniref:Energy-coupling factor transporter ATP-binding protein EcfA2 n=1 Tax=Bombilactobacillus thymidiniphilus TaxID=2923363 RepID=A0ABY4PEA1_9LACO|nr:energy-coupling factor transporter ATPase [Bombilactobacillus thymidiniphilus]UQS83972.1 energy-coupling factor transporter ATPase [Bombilactobacillus thymidiniphilus]
MAIIFQNVTHVYQADGPLAYTGLKDISFQIRDGSYTAIIGRTGSGKSTLVQHINALLKPTAGKITVSDHIITPETKNKHLKPLRKKVGVVFQFPEQQLFADTVIKDISFGPKNFGMAEKDAEQLALTMLKKVNLSSELAQKSPFELSGGQMRRVAIAGVLASQPDILILDEPTAGLDPKGHQELMELFAQLNRQGTTIILISHQMEDVAQYSNQVLVMEKARLIRDDTPQAIFTDKTFLQEHQLLQPESTKFARLLADRGFKFARLPITTADLVNQIVKELGS